MRKPAHCYSAAASEACPGCRVLRPSPHLHSHHMRRGLEEGATSGLGPGSPALEQDRLLLLFFFF